MDARSAFSRSYSSRLPFLPCLMVVLNGVHASNELVGELATCKGGSVESRVRHLRFLHSSLRSLQLQLHTTQIVHQLLVLCQQIIRRRFFRLFVCSHRSITVSRSVFLGENGNHNLFFRLGGLTPLFQLGHLLLQLGNPLTVDLKI